jgi:hypothetical protein
MNLTGKQIGIGAACLLALSTTAGAVSNFGTIRDELGGFWPASRGYVLEIAENLTTQQQDNDRRWLEVYEDKLLETELQQQQQLKETSDVNGTLRLFEARKRTIKNQIKLLQQKSN